MESFYQVVMFYTILSGIISILVTSFSIFHPRIIGFYRDINILLIHKFLGTMAVLVYWFFRWPLFILLILIDCLKFWKKHFFVNSD